MQRSYEDIIGPEPLLPTYSKATPELHQESLAYLPRPKHDGRLFPQHTLYCEGHPRPLMRGMLHLLAATVLPFAWWRLHLEANGRLLGEVAGGLYMLSNIFCYGTSAIFHVGRWSARTEILLQKIDHCGIAILSTGTMIPVATLLLPSTSGMSFLALTSLACAWTCTRVFQLRPSVWRQVVVPGTCLPFLPVFYFVMTPLEWAMVWATMALQLLGTVVFVRGRPRLFPAVFGYHELFHLLVIMAGGTVYLANLSIVRRTCNPYDLHTDISEVLWHWYTDR